MSSPSASSPLTNHFGVIPRSPDTEKTLVGALTHSDKRPGSGPCIDKSP